MFQPTFSPSPAYSPHNRRENISPAPTANIVLHNERVSLAIIIPSLLPGGHDVRIMGGLSGHITARDDAIFAVVQQMVAWIEHNLDERLSVEKISQKSGYSVWHFQRKFVQFTGLNVYEYVRIRRVISAAFALTRTRKKILEIAVENGFSCQTAFTRTLRKMTRLTPGQMRRQFTGHDQGLIHFIGALLHPANNREESASFL